MRIYTEGRAPSPEGGSSLTVGTFDGVHLGHQALVGAAAAVGRRRSLPVGLLTFDPHPAEVVRPEAAPLLITTVDQRLELLGTLGLLDFVVVVPFDERRRRESPEDFVGDLLVDRLGARCVTVGDDFRFGHRRAGDPTRLAVLGRELGFEAQIVPPVREPSTGERISSSLVRHALATGDLERAQALLGHGDRLGTRAVPAGAGSFRP